MSLVAAVLIGTGGVGALVTSALLPRMVRGVQEVLASTMNKQESSSYQDRTSTDVDSLAIVLPTYEFGVGWGSNRSSSLVPGILATLAFMAPWDCCGSG